MNTLWANVFRPRQDKKDTILSILKRIPVFEKLTPKELPQIERILHERHYRSDEPIFHQGDPGLGMYIIVEGDVGIVSEPERHVLARLHDGEFFGELSLLDDSPRTATAIAETPCRVLCLLQSDLYDLIDRQPRLGARILIQLARTIGERLKRTNEHVYALKKEKEEAKACGQ